MNIFPPGTNHDIMAKHDGHAIRLRAAFEWFKYNSQQVYLRKRAGEQVFMDLVKAQNAAASMKNQDIEQFISQVEIIAAEYGDIIAWPEEVAIARKTEPRA